MLWRRQIEKAMLFIYERLRDSESQVPWRKLPLRFRYIQALFSARSADRALLEINAIHNALYRAHQEHGLPPDVIQEHWQTVEAFKALLAASNSRRSN